MTEKIRNKAVAQDFANQDLLNVKLKKLGSDPTRVEGVLQYQENQLRVGGASEWILLANDADLQDHIADTTNIHAVSLEQARSVNNTLGGNIDADGYTIVGLADPTNAGDAANRGWTLSQIDVAKNNFDYKQEVRCAATSNVSIATGLVNGASVGGVTLATGDRVLLVGQTNTYENGIYVAVASGAASRAPDADSDAEVTTGLFCAVIEGTKAGAAYVLTTTGTITLDDTGLTFAQYFAGASYSAGDGISLSGSTFSVNVSNLVGAGIENDGSNNFRISSAAAGEGLTGGGGSALSVNADIVGGSNLAKVVSVSSNGVAIAIDDVTIGENGSNQLFLKAQSVTGAKLGTGVAGNGLTGGSGSAISALSDSTGGSNLAKAVNVSSNGLAVKIDDSTIGENGSARLFVKNAGITATQLATSVAGNGLTGGAGTAFSVVSDATGGSNLAKAINVSANGVAVKVDGVTIQGNGSDQLEIKSSVFGSGLSYSSNIATVNWASQKYNMSFNADTDWGSVNGDGQYVITVTAATHGLGTEPVVIGVVGIDGSSNKYGTELYHEVNTSGDVLIYVTGSAARFAGKLYLVKA